MFLFIGGPEIFIVLLVIVMFFGADKIPEMARFLGKGMKQIKEATNDIKREINTSAATNGIDLDVVKDIEESVDDVTKDIDDMTGPIKRSF